MVSKLLYALSTDRSLLGWPYLFWLKLNSEFVNLLFNFSSPSLFPQICMSFIKDTVVDEETPCWFEIWLLKVKEHVRRKSVLLLRFLNHLRWNFSIAVQTLRNQTTLREVVHTKKTLFLLNSRNVFLGKCCFFHLFECSIRAFTKQVSKNIYFIFYMLTQVTLTTNRNAKNANPVT